MPNDIQYEIIDGPDGLLCPICGNTPCYSYVVEGVAGYFDSCPDCAPTAAKAHMDEARDYED